MIYIDDDMRRRIDNALADRCPMFIATVSPDGEPQISMRGSVLVFDRETLRSGSVAGAIRQPTSRTDQRSSCSTAIPLIA